jgi:uncharacterized protein (DUF111 family)
MKFNHGEEHVDEEMILLQANIDDMNPELCSYTADLLFAKGANDVYWIPIVMKKGRPGLMLNVLISEKLLTAAEQIIFTETTTLGIRYMQASVHRLGRRWVDVQTEWGTISIKLGIYQGGIVQYAPEFDQCEQISKQNGVPLKMVYDAARTAYQKTAIND